jgi:hypothetical protein
MRPRFDATFGLAEVCAIVVVICDNLSVVRPGHMELELQAL